MKTVTEFIFLASKITADGDCSHKIKKHLFFGRIAMTNLDNILQSRDITLPTRALEVKVTVFPAVKYRCESCHCLHCSPIYLPWSDATILVFWMLSFKPTFSLSSFTFIKRIFSSSSLSLLCGPTLTSIHDYWKNHSFDYTNLCWQTNVSAF